MLAPPKFLNFCFYYIEIFNFLIISPQKWDLAPLNYLSWSNNVLKKKFPICLVVIDNVLFLKFIFYGKMCSSIFLNFGSFMSLNTSLIQLKFFYLQR